MIRHIQLPAWTTHDVPNVHIGHRGQEGGHERNAAEWIADDGLDLLPAPGATRNS